MSKLLLNTAKALLQYAKNKENETTRGGNNTALVSNNKGIPKLEKDIINTYENGNRNQRQQTANLYNDVKNTMTENLLSALGQKDQARGRADAYTEDIRRTGGSLNPMNYNSLADYMLNAPYSAQAVLSNKAEDTLNKAYDKTNDKPWYKSSPLEYALGKTAGKLGFTGNRGTLTEEMKNAGLTQEDLDRWNKAENEKDRQNLLSDWAKNHKIGATLNAIPENAFGSMSGTIKKLGDYVKGNPIEERPTNADIYRQTVSDSIDSKLGKLAYGGANSIGDMLFATMLAAPLGAVAGGASAGSALSKLAPRAAAGVMGAEKANEVMNDAVNRGLDPNQIVAEGVGSGVTTALTEMLPFERFARGGNILGAMASEGLQEGAEDIADTILDELVTAAGRNQDKSTLHQNYNAYKEVGFSDEDALKNVIADYAKQVGTDTLMGGITGGLMGAGGNLIQGRNPITGRLPELRNVNEEVNENADVVNESIDNVKEEVKPEIEALKQEAQPIQETAQKEIPTVQPDTSRRELRDLTELATQYKGKLSAFSKSDYKNEVKTLTKAIDTAIKSGDVNAIRDALANADNVMQGAEIGVNARQFNKDSFQAMQDATDGYKIKVNPKDLADLGVNSVTELDRSVNTGSNNRLHFVKSSNENGFYIDEVYDDIREKSGYALPSSDGMNTVQMLQTLRDYISQPKAGRDEMVNTRTWNDIGTDRPAEVNQAVDLGYDMLEKLMNGYFKDSDARTNAIGEVMETFSDIAKKYPEYEGYINDTMLDIHNIMNGITDEDVKNIRTMEEASTAIGNELEGLDAALRMDTGIFSENKGEIPNLEKDNGVHTGKFKTSKFATNTYPNSGAMSEEEYSNVIPDDIKQYETVTHESTLNKAEENVKRNGYTGEYNRLLNDDNWDAVDVDTAMLCAMKAADEARAAEAVGVDSNEAWSREVGIFKKARKMATAGGQMIEAFKKWSAMTAEGKLAQAISFVNEVVKEEKNELDLPKDVKTAAEKYLSDEVMAEFLKKAHQYDGQDVSLLKQARLNAELAHMINEQIPVKFRAKFNSLWLDNLLASFRTLISRNFGGNIGKAVLDQSLVKAISGPIDKFIGKFTGTRTTTGFTREGLKEYWKGFKKAGKQTFSDYWTPNADPDTKLKLKDLAKEIDVFADANVTNRAGVNELNFKESLKGNRTTFKNKALKLYDKVIKFGLAIGDNPFYGGTYAQTELELKKLREQGKLKLPDDITDEEFDKWVKAVATAQGLEAVYQDSSELSQGAMDIKNGIAKCSKGFMGFDPISNTSMPFVSTPMNVVKTNLELSPLGIVKNAVQTVKEIRTNLENNRNAFDTESFDQRRFVRETSRNAVGLLLFATGLMMKNAGLLTGGYSDDDREKQAQKDAGMQEYALVSPFTGNQWSINWIPGAGSTLISAAAFDDAFDKPDQSTLDAVLNGTKAGAQSLFEQAALQGLQRLTGSANYSSDNKIVDNVVQTVANTASSAILPSIVRQTAAALDPYKRNTYGMGGKESIINNAIAGVPFLRQQLLEPRIGMNGEPIEQNAGRNTAEKWFDNLINPALVTVPSALENPVRDEASRLYEETKDPKAFQPKISLNYLKVDDHIPTTKEYTEFLQIADKAMNQAALDLMDSDYYDNLSSEQKVEALNGMYSTIQKVERANYLDLETDFSGADKAYDEGGEEGLINYIIAKSTLNEMGLQNNPANRDKVIQKMDEGGSGAVQEMVDQAQELEDAGLSKSMQFSYEHANKYIPSLTPSEFAETYNAINADGNTSIKQSEVIDYLNQHPDRYDDTTAMQYWNAFDQKAGHDGQWKKIPVLNPETGLWEAK